MFARVETLKKAQSAVWQSKNHVERRKYLFSYCLSASAISFFTGVESLGMKEKDGSYVGFWGAMCDETMSFLPWSNHFTRGYYLAGIEVYQDTDVPEGWKMWVMPARKYLVMEVKSGEYRETFLDGIEHQIPSRNLRLAGAVCDYIRPATGMSFLFFPVEEV